MLDPDGGPDSSVTASGPAATVGFARPMDVPFDPELDPGI
jgi:hypothetical protein